MTDIVEVADGQLIEPPLTVEQRLAEHCAYSEATFTNGDYFHLLAKDAAALIASQAARIRELEERIADIATRMDRQVKASDGYAEFTAKKDEMRPTTWQISNSHFTDLARELRSLLSRKGGE